VDKAFQENIMGDSTDMTVEFLRARLLSERSVSRAARQRADLLAKRVCFHAFFLLCDLSFSLGSLNNLWLVSLGSSGS